MDSLWIQLVLVGGLVVMNAVFAGSEIALVSLREGQLQRLEHRGGSGATLAHLARDSNRFLSTIQIGVTLAGFLASATAAVTLAEPLVVLFEPLGGGARPVAIFVVTLVLSYVTLVLGELAPKRIALQRPEAWGLLVARPLAAIATAAGPAIWLLSHSTDLVVRLFGGDPDQHREEVTEEEIRDLVATQAEFTPDERALITGAIEFADRTLREIVIPRPAVVAIAGEHTAETALRELLSSGHSRAPVYTGDLDNIVGVVHLRSLIGAGGPVRALAQPTVVLPESADVFQALRRLQQERQQMAIVVNEHGGTEGIITIEDLMEELVGEIYDEADPDVAGVERGSDGSVTLVGSFPVHDLDDIGFDVPAGPYTTVAGFLLDRLGHLPEPGERVIAANLHFDVLEVEGRAISRVRISPADAGPRH